MEVMIDLETMGNTARAPIATIGAVAWSQERPIPPLENLTKFQITVDLRSQKDREFEPDTIYWWLRQDPKAQAALAVPPVFSIQDALMRFREWCLEVKAGGGDVGYWSLGATFDLVILADAYKQYGISCPFPYNRQYCARTVLDKNYPGKRTEVPGLAHRALDDAYRQAVWMNEVAMRLKGEVK